MSYILQTVLESINKRKIRSILFFLEFTLCLSFSLTGLNQHLIWQEQKNKLDSRLLGQAIPISIYANGNSQEESNLLSWDSLKTLEMQMKDRFIFYYGYRGVLSISMEQEVKGYPLVSVNESFYQEIKKYNPKVKINQTYIGEACDFDLIEGKKNLLFPLGKELEKYIIKGKEAKLGDRYLINNNIQEDQISLNKSILLPILDYTFIEEEKDIFYQNFLFIEAKEGARAEDFEMVLLYLGQTYPHSFFYYSDLIYEFQKGTEDLTGTLQAFSQLGSIGLVLVIVSFISILYSEQKVIMEEIFARYISGASVNDLTLHAWIEYLFPLLISFIVCFLTIHFLNKRFQTIYYENYISLSIFFIPIGLMIFLTVMIYGVIRANINSFEGE